MLHLLPEAALESYWQRLAVVVALFIFSIGLGVLVTQEGGRVPIRPDQIAQAAAVYEFTWSPDGKTIAYISSAGGGSDLWTIPSSGGQPKRITSTPALKKQPRWSRDGKWIAFVTIRNGTEGDIHAVSPDGSTTIGIAETQADERNPAWSPDSRHIAFTERTAAEAHLVVLDLETHTPRTLVDMAVWDLQWSPDGKQIAYVANPLQGQDDRRDNEDVYVISASGGSPRLLTAGTPRFRDSSPSWAPDSRRIAYTSEENGYSNIFIFDTANEGRRAVTQDRVDNLAPKWSPNGNVIAYVRNENFVFHIYTVGVDDARQSKISDRDGVNGGFQRHDVSPPGTLAWSPDGSQLAFTLSDPAHTSDIWTDSVNGGRPVQLTNSMPADLRREGRFVWPELLTYRSFDGQQVSGFVFKPRSFRPRAGYPALLMFRDTLDGQHSASWDPFIQFFVSNGYLVFAPNVRGSSGRGRDYRQLVAGQGGDHDVRDAFFGLDRLSSEALIDTERLGVFGAGTGGFLAASALVRDEARFKAAVSLYGIVDAVTAASYPGMSEWSRYMIGANPMENPIAYFERSLVNFVDELRTPIIFLFAGNNPAAPYQQLQQFAVQAEVKGKWYDYRIFENEPGDWRAWKPNSIRLSLEAMEVLFEKYLLDKDREIRLSRER